MGKLRFYPSVIGQASIYTCPVGPTSTRRGKCYHFPSPLDPLLISEWLTPVSVDVRACAGLTGVRRVSGEATLGRHVDL